jgi:hypothetical protein
MVLLLCIYYLLKCYYYYFLFLNDSSQSGLGSPAGLGVHSRGHIYILDIAFRDVFRHVRQINSGSWNVGCGTLWGRRLDIMSYEVLTKDQLSITMTSYEKLR